MQLSTLKTNIAENLNQLASDGTTIAEGRITEEAIERKINQVYRDELFPLVSDKFPQDFERETYLQNMRTADGIIVSITDTTLVANSGIFDNSMRGFTVYNITQSDSSKIEAYTSSTTVELEDEMDWDANDVIVVLGNEYTLEGNASDFKEIRQIRVKYAGQSDFVEATRINKEDAYVSDLKESDYSKDDPKFYLGMLAKTDGTKKRMIGFLPFPTTPGGKFFVRYIEKPSELTDATDETQLSNIGIDQVIIDGVTAWGYGLLEKWSSAKQYRELYMNGKRDLIMNYKPKSRSGSSSLKESSYYLMMQNREI